jgi:hypothetical protein
MSYALYANDNGTPVLLSEGPDAATAIAVEKTTTKVETDLPAGSSVSVPTHAPGSGKLFVYLDGILCTEGETYTDSASTSITMIDAIPAGFVITAVAYTNAKDPSDDMSAYIDALGQKADLASVKSLIATKAEKTDVDAALDTKLDTAVYESEKTTALENLK